MFGVIPPPKEPTMAPILHLMWRIAAIVLVGPARRQDAAADAAAVGLTKPRPFLSRRGRGDQQTGKDSAEGMQAREVQKAIFVQWRLEHCWTIWTIVVIQDYWGHP